jgi:hypothetical protein
MSGWMGPRQRFKESGYNTTTDLQLLKEAFLWGCSVPKNASRQAQEIAVKFH